MLQWIYHLKPTHPSWEGSEDILFTTPVRNKLAREVLEILKSSVIAVLCRPDLTVVTEVTEL